MKAAWSRKRKWMVAVGIVSALVAVTLLMCPIWFPWVLAPLVKPLGIRFGSYHAIGWTRFVVTDARADYDDLQIECKRLEAPSLLGWVGARYLGGNPQTLAVLASDWRIHIAPQPRAAGDTSPTTVTTVKVIDIIETILAALRQWLPESHVTNGVIELMGEKILVPSVHWNQGKVLAVASFAPYTGKETIQVRGDFSTNAAYAVRARAKPSEAEIEFGLKRVGPDWDLQGAGFWLSNRVGITAHFAPQGGWPQRARIEAREVRLPPELLKLEGYAEVSGAFAFDWAEGRFDLYASGDARSGPGPAETHPPLAITMRAQGDTESVVVQELQLTTPGGRADLTDRVGISRAGRLLTGKAALNLAIDLAKLPWLAMGGTLQGRVQFEPRATEPLQATFELSGTGLTRGNLKIKQALLSGDLDWPQLNLARVEVTLPDASQWIGSARLDLKAKVASAGRWRFQGRLPEEWRPEALAYSQLQTTGQFSGPLTRPLHSGRLTVEGLSLAQLKPSGVEVGWQGAGFDLTRAEIQLNAGASRLSLSGTLRAEETNHAAIDIVLERLIFERQTQTLYALRQPVSILIQEPSATNRSLRVGTFDWTGDSREIHVAGEVQWPRRGALTSRWRGVALDEFQDFLELPALSCVVSNLDVSATWNGGPVTLALSGQLALAVTNGTPFSAQARLQGDATGLRVEQARVADPAGDIFFLEGTLPVELVPGRPGGILRWDEKQAMDLHARTAPNAPFWQAATELIGIRLVNPAMNLAIRGTLAQPLGLLQAHADRIEWQSGTNRIALPTLENLDTEAEFKRESVQLNAFTVELEGQPVRARGKVPLGTNFWTDLVARGGLPDWRQASGSLEIVDARLAVLARYLPDILSPQGRLSLEVAMQPGARLEGALQITNAATRPLMPLGRIHEISAQVRFRDRAATIENFSGEIGGQPVKLTGHASLAEQGRFEFEAALRGTNVPLVREPGVLLRSDLNLQIVQKKNQATTVAGEVTLRESLFLQDLKALVPAGPTHQRQRPPYFSVEDAPFADWRLNLRIRGERCLRVRTPLFRGEISAFLQLTGPMKEPVANGEVRIASGRVQFPFCGMNVDQGYITLTSENPYRPSIYLSASGRTYGYALKLELSGPADEPRVTFGSTPALTSEQIILMVTAGELPNSGVRLSSQQRATRLGMFVGSDFLGRVIGEDAGGDRLTIRSAENVTDEGQQTYYLEYRLTDDWSLVGEYDRFNALNAGFKWRIFSK